ncbi:MAG: tryptophan synthase subunit alpha [Pseudomonadota bacterium]
MTVERIDRTFARAREQGRPALVAFLVIGDPSVEESLACARAALEAGADALELGVPFSDPTADGPVIAAAGQRAIARGGSLRAALSVARELRATSDAPLVLFSYYNPIVMFGEAALPRAAAEAGVDGVLVVDLPPEEGALLRTGAREAELAMIPLVAPTTGPERERKIYEGARGFLYYVSVTGITGTTRAPLADAGRDAAALAKRAGLPVIVGFGVRTPDDARTLARAGVDGIAVGTEIVRAIASGNDTASRVRAVSELVSGLRAALDG